MSETQIADAPDSLSVAEFRKFVLNALLVPLIDDAAPPRWVDPWVATNSSLVLDCAGSRVTVDGLPIKPGDSVPPVAFTLRWEMDRCGALNGAFLLSGTVELVVFHDGDSYSVSVQPAMLHVTSASGDSLLRKSFATQLPLAP